MPGARVPQDLDRNIALDLVRVTEAAAMAAGRWVGRGDKNGGDGAAVDAMRKLINSIQMRGVVVIGEGEKDDAPMLYNANAVIAVSDRGRCTTRARCSTSPPASPTATCCAGSGTSPPAPAPDRS